jgi:cytosine/adenosine deaminase-related metal-dependent hydrolase
MLAPGAVADLVAVRLDSVRTAGGGLADAVDRVVFGAGAADVTDVVVGGRRVVAGGEHLLLGDVGGLIGGAVAALG